MARSLSVIQGDLSPLPNDVIVSDMEQGDRLTKQGLYLLDDNSFDDKNIKPRWCKVYKVGEKVKDVAVGQWILVEHGRWSYGVTFNTGTEELYLQKVDIKSILMVSDTYLGERRF